MVGNCHNLCLTFAVTLDMLITVLSVPYHQVRTARMMADGYDQDTRSCSADGAAKAVMRAAQNNSLEPVINNNKVEKVRQIHSRMCVVV